MKKKNSNRNFLSMFPRIRFPMPTQAVAIILIILALILTIYINEQVTQIQQNAASQSH